MSRKTGWQGFPGGLDGKNLPAMQEAQVRSLGQEDPLEKKQLPNPVILSLSFPGDSAGKASAYHVGDLGQISGLRRSPGEGNCYQLQYSGLENSIGSQRIRHDQSDLACMHIYIYIYIHITEPLYCTPETNTIL